MSKKLSIVIPCYKRPKRTLRLLQSIMEQDFQGFEAIFIGDGCHEFQTLLDTKEFDSWIKLAEKEGNTLIFENLKNNWGGYGTWARARAIELATGTYTIFIDNDDVILPDHFKNYYELGLNNPNMDLGLSNTFVEPNNHIRVAELRFGAVGHAEIVVRTELLKRLYKPNPEYGHDWELIQTIVNSGAVVCKSNKKPTYVVKGIPDKREFIFD